MDSFRELVHHARTFEGEVGFIDWIRDFAEARGYQVTIERFGRPLGTDILVRLPGRGLACVDHDYVCLYRDREHLEHQSDEDPPLETVELTAPASPARS
jgi:hypothetical protein